MVVFTVRYLLLVDEGLEVGAVFDAVWGIDVDHLDLTAQGFFFQETVHHQQAVARDEAVAPVVGVLVELDGFAQGRIFLLGLKQGLLPRRVAVALAHRLDDGAGIDSLVDMQGDGGDGERGPLRFARPVQSGVDMRIMIRRVAIGGGGGFRCS